ncbi:DUF6875 domain-containing protein [Streptosporangium sp. NBC_01755]|uniref:DUF6875 domain-containing protein n=1 Tax=Streptosporangium sp. NBC_01755 TaxID=2975949 RepID=UPI002DD86190|nr:hypothetical protein [Streptosporangium sp. NBC_01755]
MGRKGPVCPYTQTALERGTFYLPLGSPVPLLAIRHMVPTGFPFLRDDPEQVAAYLERFGDRPPAALRAEVQAVADRYGLVPANAS